jgi:hypothetical protein
MTSPTCPECGRPIPAPGAKLCPHCGYPLMLDRQAPVQEVQHKIVHKPVGPTEAPSFTLQAPQPMMRPGYGQPSGPPPPPPVQRYAPPPRAQAFGPHCPACHQVNPPHRKRCEVCGAELWPGAAMPARWMPDPPAIPIGRPRRQWWKTALAIGIPLAVMGGVWALAAFL